ncbi:MAG: acyltransferase, partial [Muribaculaceae bacterium]|nr:acyltransferase [Muribaculaceae bacterium]
MNLSGLILKAFGWKVKVSVPDYPKCIICVAPHTSNWDFIIGKLAYASIGRKAGFLMKDTWFFWPMGCLFRAIGGVA